jgi:hypothetical protein
MWASFVGFGSGVRRHRWNVGARLLREQASGGSGGASVAGERPSDQAVKPRSQAGTSAASELMAPVTVTVVRAACMGATVALPV